MHRFRNTFKLSLIELEVEIKDRQKFSTNAFTTTTKIYTHPNFELAMQYVNQVALYGKECNHSVTIKTIKASFTRLLLFDD